MPDKGTVERAFELAKTGNCADIEQLRRQLETEGHENLDEHFDSGSLTDQLRALMKS